MGHLVKAAGGHLIKASGGHLVRDARILLSGLSRTNYGAFATWESPNYWPLEHGVYDKATTNANTRAELAALFSSEDSVDEGQSVYAYWWWEGATGTRTTSGWIYTHAVVYDTSAYSGRTCAEIEVDIAYYNTATGSGAQKLGARALSSLPPGLGDPDSMTYQETDADQLADVSANGTALITGNITLDDYLIVNGYIFDHEFPTDELRAFFPTPVTNYNLFTFNPSIMRLT